ncbi:inorganic pyrophosphatase [Emiliania huxleyi CCMP1516]|uniref:Inorganic diphosphatase n=2 Tax=Emiliania huxleyi TaxID=2903 RepID=A0A0D3KDI2_EMIH1|nr:inorganic pyrophosphatase [Emiliania huxleyi CCMP1516]EOD33817.1 inorganic pyrophosphatase [Emiliania huxleyi CCMP1516]|eukprot:XP_005786246.1 inorganic pyrophosphatase [Emiliania huxleyi CCMP1516]
MSSHHYSPVDAEDLPGSYRYRQKTLQRWRFSMFLSFAAGVVVCMIAYPRLLPCKACAPCEKASPPVNVADVASRAAQIAVSKCPACPACPECQHKPCPACELSCPKIPECPSIAAAPAASQPDDAEVVARHRTKMLARDMVNIAECKPGQVCRADALNRSRVIGQKGITLWMTGLSGSGKTTIAEALERRLLYKLGKNVFRIDGDNLRTGLTKDLGFSPDDRAESVRRASHVAALFSEAGVITMVTLISPYRKDRDAARALHEKQAPPPRSGIPFMEVFMDVPLSVVQARDPKGLYKKVAKGLIKGFTGVDAPYEAPRHTPPHTAAPLHAELTLKNSELPVEQCVDQLVMALTAAGALSGHAMPDGLTPPDGGVHINRITTAPEALLARRKEAETLPKVPLTDIDVNWLQVVGEGWAAPLRGFMREGTLVQTLHFNSVLHDPNNVTGDYNSATTDWMQSSFPRERVSSPVPIVLPVTDFTRRQIAGAGAVALTNAAGVALAILRSPEVYELRVRELIHRTFGMTDDEHPYVKELLKPGKDYAVGGEVELLGKITYNDGLDAYRLTAEELRAAFKAKGADVVYAFQTRNPTHAGHAFLMKDSRQKLMARGYKKPVLWLSPLGGWTKASDVPLDVRVKQHQEVMAAGELHPDWTVMAIWPSPMIYAGPTEVQFHAKSRRAGGASYFTVGRDPAGMPYSSDGPGHEEGDDIYHPDHGRYALMSSPGVGGMQFLGFSKVYYDKKDHTMRGKDESRPDDFISISGSKMRKLAALAAKPCPPTIPSDLIASKCIPPGFMVQKGWEIVSDYYIRQKTGDWVPYSKQLGGLPLAPNMRSSAEQPFGKVAFTAHFVGADGAQISPWHNLALYPTASDPSFVNFVCEIPRGATAKLEVQKEKPFNPIMQDTKKGALRYYTYGASFFNYGMLPQTWEDPAKKGFNGTVGDNDPLDVMDLSSRTCKVGEMRKVKILGDLELIDQGELDHKIIVVDAEDPLAASASSAADLPAGVVPKLVEWLKRYKTTDGKPENKLASDTPTSAARAAEVVKECHESWQALKARGAGTTGFWLG